MAFLDWKLYEIVFSFLDAQASRQFLRALGGQVDSSPGVHSCYINIILLYILDDSFDMMSQDGDDQPRGDILEEVEYE